MTSPLSIVPPFQNREESIDDAAIALYNTAHVLLYTPEQTRGNQVHVLSQFFGAGKSRFVKELKDQIYNRRDIIKDKIGDRLNQSVFDMLLEAQHIRVLLYPMPNQPEFTFNPALINRIATELDITQSDSLFSMFENYAERQDINRKTKLKMIIISIDEFNLPQLYGCNSSKSNLIKPWRVMSSISSFMAEKGLVVCWIWSGKDISFLDIASNMSAGSPTGTHWIMLECLKPIHVERILETTFRDLYSYVNKLDAVNKFVDQITEFTGGVPRYLVFLLNHIQQVEMESLKLDHLPFQLPSFARIIYQQLPADFVTSEKWKNDINLRRLVTLIKLLSKLNIKLSRDSHFDLGDGNTITSTKIINMFPAFISNKYPNGTFTITLPPMVLSTIEESSYASLPTYIDSLPQSIIDSGEILEFACIFSLFQMSDITRSTIGNLLPWITLSFHHHTLKPLKFSRDPEISNYKSAKLENKMKNEKNFLLQPSQKANCADLYCKINHLGIALQAKNGKQQLGWSKVAVEMEKMGEFSTFMHYVFVSISLNEGISEFVKNDEFISLEPGYYYYSTKNSAILIHQNQYQFYLVLPNTEKILLTFHESKDQLNQSSYIKIGDNQFLSGHSILEKFKHGFNERNYFTVPQQSRCIILGRKQLTRFLGRETYNMIREKWVESESSSISHQQFIQSLFLSSRVPAAKPPKKHKLSEVLEEPPTKRSRIEETPELASSGGTGTEQRDYTGAVNFNSKGKGITSWSVEQVADWMKTIGNGKFADCSDTAIKEEIDGDVLAKLTKKETKDWFGVTIGKASKLCDAIQEEVSKSS
eukprot:gb/GECH01011033.1/.p1 GENE.gb/GECH01011033.1/~~gb/GECH01011033.1/.p1  ORF type:complete len:817 (+),score=127.65 gb/GECH01011033.1/:1-2451(+)